MRILARDIIPGGPGKVQLKVVTEEDFWHVYNLVSKGDVIKACTFRKVKEETKTGSVVNTKRKLTLLIRIETIDYDAQGPAIRLGGTNVGESDYVQLNQFHTLDIIQHIPFSLYKKYWDQLYLERLEEATNAERGSEVAAIVMEEGLANVCLITDISTIVKARIESSIPRKRKGASGHDKSLFKFFEKCVQALTQYINFDQVTTLIVASPGFVKDQFLNYLEDQKLKWYRSEMIVDAHASNGEKQALVEVLSDVTVRSRLSEIRVSGDMGLIDDFFKMLNVDMHRAIYSLKDVEAASEQQAIETLLICDSILRDRTIASRRKISTIISRVKENGGTVKTVSSLHVAGEKLMQLSGIAALLRFPMYDLQEQDESDEEQTVELGKVNLEDYGLGLGAEEDDLPAEDA